MHSMLAVQKRQPLSYLLREAEKPVAFLLKNARRIPHIYNAEITQSCYNFMKGKCYNSSGCGCNSVVECQLPKLKVAGSNPVARSII